MKETALTLKSGCWGKGSGSRREEREGGERWEQKGKELLWGRGAEMLGGERDERRTRLKIEVMKKEKRKQVARFRKRISLE